MIVCWSVVFHYVGLFFSYLMIAHEHYRALFYLNGVVFLINIVLNVILIAEYSIVGAAVASVVSQFCFSLFSFVIFLVKVKR